ncbi:aldehyde dehydrogenase family protein [Paraliomyxa miuraensis]|uniref:aldehyde dehydrogenase family protein n=1 Tax=Paraliomyxa miuraensis TaxID=376150 RepID=UPI00224D9AC2|nr:aldehyde dehydrogenase family protein [Paraliomyxa miuraensis]MCX4243714.1 aldehyde dehydrogenase family protein [Paraliomyxa miuraensis]
MNASRPTSVAISTAVPDAIPDLGAASGVIRCFDPATRELLGTVPVDGPPQVRAAIARAREAQVGWRETSFALRRRVLRRVADAVLSGVDDLCELIVRDSGKTRENALMGEIWTVLEKLRWTASQGPKHLRPEPVSAGLFLHKRARLEYHPLGVIGAIIPWNYPLQNIMNPLIPALMAGNGIVIKPSEWVAWSARRFVQLVRDALVAEGQSPELVQVVQGYGETGQALIAGGIDSLVFIGSVKNGQRVLEAAARTITPVVLELGGKDPFIVCDDAELEPAVHAALAGCFISAGQNCVAAERLLVFDAIYDRFAERVGALVGSMRQGQPMGEDGPVDVGAMVTPMQLQIVERLVARAIEQGARVVAGGHRVLADRGDYFAPTVLADVTPDMDIMREETFGPVMLLCRVRDEHHAIEIANGTGFGLSSSVWSRDRARARRIASRLQAGMTAINEFGGMTYMAQDLTFGGIKESGFGRLNGREGLRSCCNVKAVLDDRLPVSFANRLFPVAEGDFERIKGAIEIVYGHGLRGRLRGAVELVRALRGHK